jgi:hypothetical protein
MARARSAWWTSRDAARLLGRAEAASGKAVAAEELDYLRRDAERLLDGPLPLDEHDRLRVQVLHDSLVGALAVVADMEGKP